jgi:hypothetical protein
MPSVPDTHLNSVLLRKNFCSLSVCGSSEPSLLLRQLVFFSATSRVPGKVLFPDMKIWLIQQL